RFRGSVLWGARPFVCFGRGFLPWVLKHACFRAAAPHVLVDAERALVAPGDIDTVATQIFDLHLPRHRIFAGWRDDRERRVEGHDTDVEAHLVVALACAAMRDRGSSLFVSDVDQ